jgi:quercetin dioxygenase-like cupin family protein
MTASDLDRYTNATKVSVDEILGRHGAPPWSERVVLTERVQGNFICQPPGQTHQRHYHEGESEFWLILKGEIQWEFDDETVIARAGDIVFARAGRWHRITVLGDEPSVRFAVAAPNIEHIYADGSRR